MKRLNLKNVIALLLAIVFPFVIYLFVTTYLENQKRDIEIKTLPVFFENSIGEFSLLAHTGDSLHRRDLEGKIFIAEFFFTSCPGICPVMTGQMRRVQEFIANHPGLRQDYQIISYTVDPEKDTLETLKDYALKNEINDSLWLLLTGDKAEIYDLARHHYYVSAMEDPTGQSPDGFFIHSDRFILVDKEGFIRGYYSGVDSTEVKSLMNDIIQLEIEYEKQKLRERRIEYKLPKES